MNEHPDAADPSLPRARREAAYRLRAISWRFATASRSARAGPVARRTRGSAPECSPGSIDTGNIDGVDVAGRIVVSVSTHEGHRDAAQQRVMIFVERAPAMRRQRRWPPRSAGLRRTAWRTGRILGDLLEVERADIGWKSRAGGRS